MSENWKKNVQIPDYAVFVISYNRGDKLYSLDALRRHGYTGDVYVVIGDDEPRPELYWRLKEQGKITDVLQFSKQEARKYTPMLDNFKQMKVAVFARNACYRLAEQLGYEYFIELDDDYTGFYLSFVDHGRKKNKPVANLDYVFDAFWKYYVETDLDILAFAQAGEFIGGSPHEVARGLKRKAMNVFFLSTKKPITFFSRMNDDVCTYVLNNMRGKRILTVTHVDIVQKQTQKNAGGMTDVYNMTGTYIKSFYPVMINPVGMKVSTLKQKNWRIHHITIYENVAPFFVREEYKKGMCE